MKRARTIVMIVSILVALVGVVLYLVWRLQGLSTPLWDEVAMAYGLVFCLGLFLDLFAKSFARLRTDADDLKPRPRPQPGTAGTVVPAPSHPVKVESITLGRVQSGQQEAMQTMFDTAVDEMFALEGVRADRDDDGHVVDMRAQEATARPTVHPFFISVEGLRVGCCVLEEFESHIQLNLIYVESAWRRRRVASHALLQAMRFVQMLGRRETLQCAVSTSNHRARRFLEANGFHLTLEQHQDKSETWSVSTWL